VLGLTGVFTVTFFTSLIGVLTVLTAVLGAVALRDLLLRVVVDVVLRGVAVGM
tara:strand:- start:887 stop:1045 length:159 start_codon:yes stop_codon:yes gene_type:complete